MPLCFAKLQDMCNDPSSSPAPSPDPTAPHRSVAIVGRPNVGKSALFNRIAGRRLAIVHNESGVTRDRLERQVRWDDQPFELVDTGGVRMLEGQQTTDAIEYGVRAQVDAAVGKASVLILVVDSQTGLHPMDGEVAQLIRRAGREALVAVNKCDVSSHDMAGTDFASLGFPLFPVSALHNRGVDRLMQDVLARLPPHVPRASDGNALKVAVVGRPNAGKSSYINRLLHEPRMIVSEVAGTTRDSIEIPFTIGKGATVRQYRLIDTAGMRNIHRMSEAVDRFSLMRAEHSVGSSDVVVLIMDATLGPTLQDKHIAAMVQNKRKGCVLLVNKWDLAQENGITQAQYEPALRDAMPFLSHCPLVFASAQSGYNIRRSLEAIDQVAGCMRASLPTGQLNRLLARVTDRVQAPRRRGRKLKLYYATQTGTAPIEIRLYVNDPSLASTNYTEYIIRSLREQFELSGSPIVIRYHGRVTLAPRSGKGHRTSRRSSERS